MRLAWFSPMPPVRSGIAAASAEVVAALGRDHEIDVYVDASSPAGTAQLAPPRVSSAHDFVWRHRRQPYDLTVFQMGNSSHHDYAWPYLFRYPGLAVLHDAHLHHARAAALLRTRRAADYRAEFAANHPGTPAAAAELAVAGFDTHLYYSWPMTRLVAQAARTTAVHAAAMAAALREEAPGAAIETIRLGHGRLLSPAEAGSARSRVRHALGIPGDAVLFGVFGGLTPEKRIPQVLDALAHVRAYVPSARLLLAGAPAEHYDVVGDVHGRGLADAVTIAGYIEGDDELTAHLAACDVSLNLRWPTAREVSGPWLRALAAGTPTVIMDLAHLTDVPSLDPRTWVPRAALRAESGERGAESAAVTVAIDILDEDHSLRLAMRRLATDAELRARLAAAGQQYWQREHSLEAMLDDYRRVLALAAGRPAPQIALPAHLLDDGGGTLRALSRALGVAPGLLE